MIDLLRIEASAMAIKYTRDGVRSNANSRWVVEGRTIPQTRRRNLAIFMGICVACLILLLYHNLQEKRSNLWLSSRLSDAVITDKLQETQEDDTKYFVTVELKVPPVMPSEKSLLVGDPDVVKKKSEALLFKKSVRVDKESWDASTVGDELRAQYKIRMQRDNVLIEELFGDFMELDSSDFADEVSKKEK